MGSVLNLILLAVMALLVSTEAVGNRCPPRSMVYTTKPVCTSDYDCPKGRVCCHNQVNTKSCAEPSSSGSNSANKAQGGPGVYCAGVKCMPYEVCKPDPVTKRLKCQRG